MEIHDSRKKEIKQQPLIKNVNLKTPPLKIHDSRDKYKKPSFRFILFYQNNRKEIKWVILFIVLVFVIFFPVLSGTIIGDWIKDFFGTIITIVKTI